MSTDPVRPYRVELLHTARTRIKRCGKEARLLGITKDYAATIRSILENLTVVPLTWGDPIGQYKGAKLFLFRRVFGRVLTEYAVHEEKHIVYIKECKPVLGHPLESTS
jgi:hypothetical protein